MTRTNEEYADAAKTPAECDKVIANAQRAGNEDLTLLARKRKIVLQAAEHGATREAEVEAWRGIYALEEYRRSVGRSWRANRTRQAIDNRGGDILAAVDETVSKAEPTDGFQEMISAGLAEFLWERLVLRFPDLFSARSIQQARSRLGE